MKRRAPHANIYRQNRLTTSSACEAVLWVQSLERISSYWAACISSIEWGPR